MRESYARDLHLFASLSFPFISFLFPFLSPFTFPFPFLFPVSRCCHASFMTPCSSSCVCTCVVWRRVADAEPYVGYGQSCGVDHDRDQKSGARRGGHDPCFALSRFFPFSVVVEFSLLSRRPVFCCVSSLAVDASAPAPFGRLAVWSCRVDVWCIHLFVQLFERSTPPFFRAFAFLRILRGSLRPFGSDIVLAWCRRWQWHVGALSIRD